MRRNVGTVDRLARLVLAALGWWLADTIGYATAGGVVVLVVAGALAATGAAGICPAYQLLAVSTRRGSGRQATA